MSNIMYYVVSRRGKWTVKLNDKFYGMFKFKNDAIKSAMEAAEKSMERGFHAQVQVNEVGYEWKLEWNNKADYLFPFGNMRSAA